MSRPQVIIEGLAARFPACFAGRDGEGHKPLKIGIVLLCFAVKALQASPQ
jgi:sRNA-binding protein